MDGDEKPTSVTSIETHSINSSIDQIGATITPPTRATILSIETNFHDFKTTLTHGRP
jgi:hypothetical protein